MGNFFEVDKEGLAKIAARRGKSFVLFELLQNAWDTNASKVDISLKHLRGSNYEVMVTDDDPDGFKDLSHAFTLFAESEKKADAKKRGRFNLGEKLVLALCDTAEIMSTKGGVMFDRNGRHLTRKKLQKGSFFRGTLKMTEEEYEQACKDMGKVLPPADVVTVFNGFGCRRVDLIGHALITIPTEIADGEGYIRRKPRETKVEFYNPKFPDVGILYEMGIPVCETGDRFHVNVCQKIPLNLERDGVSASYLQQVRTVTLNTMYRLIPTPGEATAPWVRDALSDKSVSLDAARRVMDLRFGRDRVSYDPSDPEANNIAVSRGMTVVSGGSLSAEEWANAKLLGLIKPAGQVTPSPKPFSPDGEPLKMLDIKDWSAATNSFAVFASRLAKSLGLGVLEVRVANDIGWGFNGTYAPGLLRVNYATLGDAIEKRDYEQLLPFLIHEFAHHEVSNHLSEEFHQACCQVGAQISLLALKYPEIFPFDI